LIVVRDQHKQILQQWHYPGCPYDLKFIIHNHALFTAYDCKDSLTLVYGFLDQEKNGLSNAHFFCEKIAQQEIIKALNECYGSFIIVHCDKKTHEVILANDALGDFALHYTHDKNHLLVSDLPSALLTNHNNQINQQRIIDFFALTQPITNGSYFEQITQVNPGHFVTYKNNNLIDQRYYYPPKYVDFEHLSLQELTTKYQHLLKQAIEWQTLNQKEVAVMMSGGMDSTFVAASCLSDNKKVSSFSYIFPEFKEADENQWIASMSELNINRHKFDGEKYWPLKPEWDTSVNSPVSNPYRLLKNKLYSQVAENNIQTLLTGVYADHMYVAHIYWLVDLLKKQPLTGLKELISLIKSKGIYQGLKHVSPSKWSKKALSKPYWLSSHAQQIFQQRKNPKLAHSHPQQFNLVYGIDTAQSVWLDNEYTNQYGITIRHPYRDRRIVEFVTSIPAWLIGNSKDSKLFVHKSAQNLLPQKIIERKNTTTLKPLFKKGVLQQELPKVRDLLLHSNSCWHKFIDKNIILKMLNKPNKVYPELHYLLLWKCISLEMWLKKIKNSN
jgi:asparagine synthase (glutamine-hydrolysing)